MEIVYELLKWIHIAAWFVAILGYAMTLPAARVNAVLTWGLTAAFVLGIVLTGIASASDAVADPNNAKVGVKLLIALVAVGLTHARFAKARRGQLDIQGADPIAHVVAGLIVVNVLIAYIW